MGKIRSYISEHWSAMLTTALLLVSLVFLLCFEIGSITNFKISPLEAQFISDASTLGNILGNSLYLPLKLLVYLLSFIPMDAVFLRIASSFVGGLAAVYFYIILRKLHTKRVTAIAIVLFVTSSWFLQTARGITPVVMALYSVTALIFLSLWLPHAKHTKLAFMFAATVAASLIYTPGFLLLLFLLVTIKLKKFTNILKTVPNWLVILSGLLFMIMICPLVYSLVFGSLDWRAYLGLPTVIEPLEWMKRLLIIPAYLFARGPLQPEFNVARLPLLDIFTTMLAVLGTYLYYYQRRLSRTSLLVILVIFSAIMIALNGALWLPLLMPIVYILAAMGVAVLLQKWFTVFPRNPLARGLGIAIFCLAIATVPVYHLTRYFVVWPHNTATRLTFDLDN